MSRLLPAILVAAYLSGCPRSDAPPPLTVAPTPVEGPIRLAGDETATPLVEHLVQVFESRLPGAPIVVEAPLGLAGARAAMADRWLTGVLETAAVDAPGAGAVTVARSTVALVVGPGVRDRRMTPDALIALAGGTVGAWPGGLPRRLVLRAADDPVQRAFVEAVPGLAAPWRASVAGRGWPVHAREGSLFEALRRPGVVGIADRGNLRLHGSPTFEVDVPGRRPATVEIRVVPVESAPPRLRAFLAFATGEEGRALVGDLGFEAPVAR